jgi:copper(I)-binding protein
MFSLAPSTGACIILSLITLWDLSTRQLNPPIFHISLRTLQRALNAGDEVEVTVKCDLAG